MRAQCHASEMRIGRMMQLINKMMKSGGDTVVGAEWSNTNDHRRNRILRHYRFKAFFGFGPEGDPDFFER